MASALSNRQNCTCARKTLQTQRGRTHGAGCVRQWFRTAEPLGERRYENWDTHTHTHSCGHLSGEPGLVDKVLTLHAGSRGFDSHRGFFRSNRPGYPHPVSSELEKSGIRVAIGDCSVTERRRWRPPYQTGKTVHVHAKHYKHNEEGRTAPGVCGNGSLSHSGNVVTRIGTHTLRSFTVVKFAMIPYDKTNMNLHHLEGNSGFTDHCIKISSQDWKQIYTVIWIVDICFLWIGMVCQYDWLKRY